MVTMRRPLIVAVFAFAILGMLAPPAFAQAPTPKVTITGLFDQVTSAGANFYDGNYSRNGDHEWYARTRFRPDFTFEVGRTKAVLGLEFDADWGQTGSCAGGPGKSPAGCRGQEPGSTASFNLNNDIAGIVEVKWMYTQFDLTGKDSLMPFVPVPTVARLGAQPLGTLGTLRSYTGPLAGDFAGVSAVTTFAPNLKTNLAWVFINKELAGQNRGVSSPGPPAAPGTKTTQGNDGALIASVNVTPFPGLTVQPTYWYLRIEGVAFAANGNDRRAATDRNLAGSTPGGTFALATYAGSPGFSAYANGSPSLSEDRHTFGVDATWRNGPWGLDPMLLFQVGNRFVQASIPDTTGGGPFVVGRQKTFESSWLLDVIGSYQNGPFLLEVRPIYSPGNKARDNLAKRISYFEPINTDTSYYTGWAQILGKGVDYFHGNGNVNNGMTTNVGYDRYGRAQLGIRGTYSMTPALAFYTLLSPTWTAEKVDTDTGQAASCGGGGNGCRTIVSDQSFVQGDSRYIGTEADLGFTWRFAPNTAFDLAGGWLFAGSALDTTECVGGAAVTCAGGTLVKRKAQDAWTVASRVRFSF